LRQLLIFLFSDEDYGGDSQERAVTQRRGGAEINGSDR
jgi:hypothetical protein